MNVVSGLAFGIDTAAHKGALDADGGKTVAVLGCGIDTIYPAANKRLAAEIIKRSGCIVSEYPPEEPGVKWHFPERNRIISGLTSATMVVQAPNKSGAYRRCQEHTYKHHRRRGSYAHRDRGNNQHDYKCR